MGHYNQVTVLVNFSAKLYFITISRISLKATALLLYVFLFLKFLKICVNTLACMICLCLLHIKYYSVIILQVRTNKKKEEEINYKELVSTFLPLLFRFV